MRTSTSSTAAAVLGGLALVGALAGCSTPAPTTGTDSGTGSGTDSGTDSGTASGTYTDGTYTESGEYTAPSGIESVDVTITLADNVITAVEVVSNASDPQAKQYQGQFVSGISAAIVGKNIDEIQVDRIGGSSLTSGGFNKAVDLIKADAAS